MNLKIDFVKNCIYQSCRILLLLVISACFANGQSKDIKNPTPLTSKEISGVIDNATKGNIFYYSFWANPGELKVTITVEPNMNDNRAFLLTTAQFSLLNSNSEALANMGATTYYDGGARQAVANVQITKRQSLVLAIKFFEGNFFAVGGKYKVVVEGADISSDAKSSTSENHQLKQVALEIVSLKFPEKGYMLLGIKNKSASLLIDFRLVESINISGYPVNQLKTNELSFGETDLPKEGTLDIRAKNGLMLLIFDLSQISGGAIGRGDAPVVKE